MRVHFGLKKTMNLVGILPLMEKLVGFLEEIETPLLELTIDGRLQKTCILSSMNLSIIISITIMELTLKTIVRNLGKWKKRLILNMESIMFMDLINMESIFIIFGDGLMETLNLLQRTEVGWHEGKW